ncbi:hypothetical protein ACFLVY_02185 [Chloroflexota bacterium]
MLDWEKYIAVADRFQHKARQEDREDLKQDIIVRLADVERNNGHKPFTEVAMFRIASYAVAEYWRAYYRRTHGISCGECSQRQRQECRKRNYADCPRAIKIESLSKPIIDSEGNITELGELIADDKATDVGEWLDTRTFLLGCPTRLIEIADKKVNGQALDAKDQKYLWRFRQKEQKQLV